MSSSAPSHLQSVGSHNAEDWEVLQQILNEADADDDDQDDYDEDDNYEEDHGDYDREKRLHKDRQHPVSNWDHFKNRNERSSKNIINGGVGPPSQLGRTASSGSRTNSNAGEPFMNKPLPLVRSKYSNASSAMGSVDVDAILQSIGSEDDDEDDVFSEFNEIVSRISTSGTSSNPSHRKQPLLPPSSHGRERRMLPPRSSLSQETETTKNRVSGLTKANGGTTENRKDEKENANVNLEEMTATAMKQAEAYERKLLRPGQRDIVSPLMVKRRMKPKIELQTRSRMQHTQKPSTAAGSSTTANKNQPRFDFAGIIESKNMPRISAELFKNAQLRKTTVGLPTALAVNSKFIAIGTQRGIVLVFDLFEGLRQQLGRSSGTGSSGTGDSGKDGAANRNNGSVTSIDVSLNGETLVSGYTSGAVILWDVIKGTVLKSVTDVHPSPITSVRFISERDNSVVSVDAGGLVNKLSFSKNLLWSTYSVDTECLLDGTAGQILAMHILPPLSTVKMHPRPGSGSGFNLDGTAKNNSPYAHYHPSIKKLILIAISSDRSSFAVAVEPQVHVLHRWAKPTPEQIGANSSPATTEKSTSVDSSETDPPDVEPTNTSTSFLPCLSWGWALVSGGAHVVTPILARSWGCSLQLLRANFPPIENVTSSPDEMHWPAFGVHDEFSSSAPIVAVEWLGERSLVYLTMTNEFTVVDTVMMTLVERLDFSGVKLVYAEFSLSRSVVSAPKADNSGNNTKPVLSTTFQNSIRSSDNRLLVLCQEEIKSVSILKTKQRITTLEEDGEWLEALALALDHYENTIKSQEDRKRDPDGRRDLSMHPEFSSKSRLSEDEEWIADLLMRYLNLAVENAPESSTEQSHLSITPNRASSRMSSTKIDLAQSHFQMLAGVCIEFCVVTRRLDLLFGPIFERFESVLYMTTFLDVLEPYILNDKLHYMAPEVMAHFVEHCKATNDVASVERCLLHMDVTIMDFDSILGLLRKNGMYSALIHVFTHGLDDFISPLEILLEAVFDSIDHPRTDRTGQDELEQYGYKAILYLQYCFNGKTFPQGKNLQPEERVDSLRPALLWFLVQESYLPSASVKLSGSRGFSTNGGFRAYPYPYMRALLMVNAKAFLDTICLVLDAPNAKFVESKHDMDILDGWDVEISTSASVDSATDKDNNACPDRQQLAQIFSSIITPMDGRGGLQNSSHSKMAKDAFLDFMAKYLLKGFVRAPKRLNNSILARMSNRVVTARLPSSRRVAHDQVIDLLHTLPRNSYNRAEALIVIEKARMPRAALLLHQAGVTALLESGENGDELAHHFVKAIDCYLEDDDSDFQREVFDYVRKECMGGSLAMTKIESADGKGSGNAHDLLRDALCEKLPNLIRLDAVLSTQIVAELYIEDLDKILVSLEQAEKGSVKFEFLHSIISGDLAKVDAVAGSVLAANLSMSHYQAYVTLMAQLFPDMVYHYLSTHDNYRTDECLALCQEYEIADASAYLLERTGNVSSALQLMLQTFEGRMMTLKRVIRGMGTSGSVLGMSSKRRGIGAGGEQKENEVPESQLKREHEIQGVKQILIVALDLCERNSGATSAKSEHGSQLWFNVLDRLINAKGFLRLAKELPDHCKIMSDLLKELLLMTMQRMVSSVPLPDLLRKITTDHAGNRLGEFREMVVSMLQTYSFELDVCTSAVHVMHEDVKSMSQEKRRLKVRGSKVHSVMGHSLTSRSPNTKFLDAIRPNAVLSVNATGYLSLAIEGSSTKTSNKDKNNVALNRLRNRRQRRHLGSLGNRKVSSANMMTMADQQFNMGESSEAAHFGRYAGELSDAEHFGAF
eukprot:CAMPEP_0198305396 /NCGR_PEP_ID=MMETSP1449-20131203/57882_1 /TAXON_ID=420275 /ORGANISM="Attheya septentrionalis, Strain CCMP2084" /LENGTH=1809 /DNA_ID=CAMNT_0044007929 /DNA_START=135 /DNA_END=5564 /DNA_ORIENTATION=-